MTHMSDVTNGASLEDSHTNFFALADLNQSNGINWRRLRADDVVCIDSLDDPVLLSYSKCLSAGILCVWRRVLAQKSSFHQQNLNDSNEFNHSKELWIFWYGEEPDLTGLVGPNLIEAEQGSWESGLSYECRILLFKALHNLIERCLLSKGFTRLGRFFIEPQCLFNAGASRSQIAFAFSFFVHGESTVCTSVDMRLAPSVYRLKKCHLQAALMGQHAIKVILSPYGMEGTLTGQVYRKSDPAVSKMLSEWYSFYPQPIQKEEESDMPVAVEVLIGGVRMKYPTSYVFVVGHDHITACNKSSESNLFSQNANCNSTSVINGKPCPSLSILTPPTSPERTSESHVKLRMLKQKDASPLSYKIHCENYDKIPLSVVVKLSVNEDVAIPHTVEGNDDSGVLWEFHDPSSVVKCSCMRKGTSSTSGESIAHSAECDLVYASRKIEFGKVDKNKPLARFTPFHKRTVNVEVVTDDTSATKNIFPSSENSLTSTNAYSNSQVKTLNPIVGPGTLGTLPQLHTPLTQPSSVDSHSNVPSVEASCSQICSSDPIMPTLSPHPKSENHDVTFTHSPNTDIGPTINIKEKHISDEMLTSFHTSLLTYFENAKTDSSVRITKSTVDSPSDAAPVSSVSNSDQIQVFKRPVLPACRHEGCDDGELVMRGVLYDYSTMSPLSCEPPARKRRIDALDLMPESKFEEMYEVILDSSGSSPYSVAPSYASKDPYEFIDVDEGTPSESFRQHIDIRIKEEEKIISPVTVSSPDAMLIGGPASQSLPLQESSSKIPSADLKSIALPSPSKNTHPKFIREEDLKVSVNDLDNIFDTSSSDNDDMPLDPCTPCKIPGNDDGNIKSKGSNMNTGLLELSRMYPTPPSLEQNAAQSPLGTSGLSEKVIFDELGRDRELSEIISGFLNSDTKENAVVWKPDEQRMFIESDKYSPLANIPSLMNPHLSAEHYYRPSWLQQIPSPSASVDSGAQFPNGHIIDLNSNQSRYLVTEDEQVYNPMYPIDPNIDQRFTLLAGELQSPASNSSPYVSKNLNSVGDASISFSVPEAHSLFVNLLLSDSMLNIFKDHNFDSCALCVCNMNIKGGDVGINLPSCLMPHGSDESQYKCTCGFSAVTYRHRSYCAGLFFEDEYDIVGFRMDDTILLKYSNVSSDPVDLKKNQESGSVTVPPSLIDLIKIQCKSMCSSFSIFQKPDMFPCINVPPQVNALEIRDYCEVCFLALEVGKNMLDDNSGNKLDESLKPTCLHRWPYSASSLPFTSQEIMLHLEALKPMLQEAVHKRNTQRLWEVTYVVEGPLTWREFHRLAARGTEDQCEPQPIPSVTVGYDKDYLSLSPFALKYWDKLLLEPYSLPRDVAYIVVAPENEYIISHVKSFFRELSSIYELYRMGRHIPITKVLRDGIMRVGRNAAMKLEHEPIDDWFNQIGDSPVSNKLKLYARVCRHRLAPHLSTLPLDKSLLESSSMKSEKSFSSATSPMPSQETPDQIQAPKLVEQDNHSDSYVYTSVSSGSSSEQPDDEGQEPPSIVIYIVEPFTFASVDENLYRTITLGLLHCYTQMLEYLPDAVRNTISLQLISLDSLLCMDKGSSGQKRTNELKALAFSVFSQCYRLLPRQLCVKSLTGFGPAAAQDMFLNANEKLYSPLKVFNQFLVLASQKDKQAELSEMFGDRQEKSGILYCCYCLTENKKWLLASCTNNNGELMETTVINIAAINRSRRKCTAVRRLSLRKLLDFIIEVLSSSVHPWRIIIGRLGHLGHGELRDWAALLSRKSLLSYSRHLRELCKQCSNLGPGDMPSILSACLVSVEPDAVLRIMPDQYTPDVHDSSSSCNTCHLSTPEDATCTHILVFPTSATMQSCQAASHQEHIDPLPGGLGDDIFDVFDDDDINVGQDINDIFRWTEMESPAQCPSNSPHPDCISHSTSPSAGGHHSPFHAGGPNRSLYSNTECLDEPLQLLQQPLALGYYVSTAKPGHLPNWFWSSCPHLANQLPIFLKFALLIHLPSIQQNSEDILHANAPHHNCHPLDSNYTTDVLRYVLEGYNALSWLSLDPSSHDRRSCLPVHIQILMQLYRIVEKLL